MYDSNHFEKSKMLEWEKKPSITKTDYTAAKEYFEELVKATDIYAQNAGGGTAGRNKYESANHMADIGKEIHEYIANLASASEGTAQEQAVNTMPWPCRSKPSSTPLSNLRTQRRTRT